jgi:hypothetical protein
VYRRANLSRTFVPVVALLLAAVSMGAVACGFPTQDLRGDSQVKSQGKSGSEQEQTGTGAATLGRTNIALTGTMTPPAAWRHRRTERI